MVLTEVMVASLQLVLASEIADSHDFISDIEALDKKRHKAEDS